MNLYLIELLQVGLRFLSFDTHREKLCFTHFQYESSCLAASDLFDMFTQVHNQLSSIHSITRIKGTVMQFIL